MPGKMKLHGVIPPIDPDPDKWPWYGIIFLRGNRVPSKVSIVLVYMFLSFCIPSSAMF